MPENITKYLKTKDKESFDSNRTLVTIATDGSISFVHMRPMSTILLYPDQVEEFRILLKKHDEAVKK